MLKSYLSRFYKQYEFWGTVLIAVSVLSILAGIIVSYRFYETLSPFLKIATPQDKLAYEATGMIGDFIGGVVGPILSFVGVLLFFLALRLQSKELGLQINELAETREVFTIQQFENTFFNLLQTQQELRLNIEVEADETPNSDLMSFINGRAPKVMKTYKSSAFFELVKEKMFDYHRRIYYLNSLIEKMDKKVFLSDEEEGTKSEALQTLSREYNINDYTILRKPENIGKIVYKKAYLEFGNKLGYYFRNLYHILSYLEEYEMRERRYVLKKHKSEPERLSMDFNDVTLKYKKYADFVQAQMSTAELFLLFYNGLFFLKMKTLMYQYDFLENLNSDDLLNPERDKLLYGERKIGGVKYPAVTLKSREELLKIY